jgi:hypothetical protein
MFRSLFPRVLVQPSSVGIGNHPNLSARDEWQAGAVMSCQYFTTNARMDMTLVRVRGDRPRDESGGVIRVKIPHT